MEKVRTINFVVLIIIYAFLRQYSIESNTAMYVSSCHGRFVLDFPGIHIESLQPAIPPAAERIDYSQEASEYERKLVQVSFVFGLLQV